MKLFVSQESGREITGLGIGTAIFFTALIILGVVNMSAAGMLVVALSLIIAVPVLILIKMTKKFGSYIDDEKLVFKRLKEKKYSIDDIKGTIILRYQVQGNRGLAQLWRINTDEYKILYLNDVLPEFYTFEKGNLDFMDLYGNYVLFHTVYDEKVIEYFKIKNIPILNKIQSYV